MQQSPENTKIAIAGAGPAGLTAAFELSANPGMHISLFEMSGIIGGISATINHHGNRMDLGGHRFFTKNDRVNAWWAERMPLSDAPDSTDRCMLLRPRVSRIFYHKKFFQYPVTLSRDTLVNMGLRDTLRAGFGFIGAKLRPLPADNLENFYINHFGRPLYKMFFEGYTEKVWGRHPSEIGADWGNQRVKGLSMASLLKDMLNKALDRKKDSSKVETSLIEQFIYPKFGPGQLWETVAADCAARGVDIAMHTRVSAVNVNPSTRLVESIETTKADGTTARHACDHFLSSMPVKDLVAAIRGIGIPAPVAAAAAGLPYRDFITVGLLVPRLAIRSDNPAARLIPDTWIYVQDGAVRMGRIQVFNNWSPYLVADPESTVWLGLEYFCNEGDDLWQMPDADFIAMAADELRAIGIIDASTPVLDSTRIRVQKAYPAYFGTYSEMDAIRNFLDTIPNLWCIGRNGQHRYNNMDHSMLTAMEASDEILRGSTSHTAVWNVNTDSEYHEEKR